MVRAQWVWRMLTNVQKVGRAKTSANLRSMFSENLDNFIWRFVNVDETLPLLS